MGEGNKEEPKLEDCHKDADVCTSTSTIGGGLWSKSCQRSSHGDFKRIFGEDLNDRCVEVFNINP